ncbi:hypothetical protein EXIGLDRAFT_723451 [Exidia glandulosa HHB12029]|uniref:Transmembrane protein n=1 Tax=Exidia glandulosa HHB12029 TaxID=1314781 RepID=A0A165EU84_EXIGL|nr:hypothetical protein EXIGLDRAFT_723451 [Exidia glandulosa HHB12029]
MAEAVLLPAQWNITSAKLVPRSSLATPSCSSGPGSALLLQASDEAGLFFHAKAGDEITVYGALMSSPSDDIRVLYSVDAPFVGSILDSFSPSTFAAQPCDGILARATINSTIDTSHRLVLLTPANVTIAIYNATISDGQLVTGSSLSLSMPSSVPTNTVLPKQSNTGLVLAIVVPLCACLCLAIMFVVWWLCRRRSRRRREEQNGSPWPHSFAALDQQQPSRSSTSPFQDSKRALATAPRSGETQPYMVGPETPVLSGTHSGSSWDSGTDTPTGPGMSISEQQPTPLSARAQQPLAEDATVGAAVLSGVRNAGFSLQDLLASLDRLRHGPDHEDAEMGAPPPLYDHDLSGRNR